MHGQKAAAKEDRLEVKPKTLSDALYFNKFEERNHSKYAVATEAETPQEAVELNIEPLNSDEEDEDEDVKRWKIKKRLEAKAEEEARQRALRARGNFNTCKMLILAV